MLERRGGYLRIRREAAGEASAQLEAEGWARLQSVFSPRRVKALAREIDAVFDALPADRRSPKRPVKEDDAFRYEMLNRSPLSQRAVGEPAILDAIEPLLGEDCHVIANTAWRNPAGDPTGPRGGPWHIDAGPHVPRPPGTTWPDEIPYPVFAIGAHILLRDVGPDDGPTAVLPGSHKSGAHPPFRHAMDLDLSWDGEQALALEGEAGDVLLFVSDVWHRRLPTGEADAGRFFLQVHYGRRDIAQRIRTTREANTLSEEAIGRIRSRRGRALLGLHRPGFYDG